MARRNTGVQPVIVGPDNRHGLSVPTVVRRGVRGYHWYARWTEAGKTRLRTLDCRVGQDYTERLNRIRAEVSLAAIDRTSGARRAADLPVGEALYDYVAVRQRTAINYAGLRHRAVNLAKFFGAYKVSEINSKLCIAYAETRPSAATARLELGTLAAALSHAAREGKIASRPHIWRPPPQPGRVRVLSRSEVAAILRAMRRDKRTKHHAITTLIAYRTAARINSVIQLRWTPSPEGGFVDFRRNVIHLNPDGRPATRKRKPTIPIPAKLLCILRGRARKKLTGPCAGPRGIPRIDAYEAAFKKACQRSGVRDAVPHVLRHTRITELLLAGHPPAMVAEFAGLSIQTLMQTYAHFIPDHLDRLANQK